MVVLVPILFDPIPAPSHPILPTTYLFHPSLSFPATQQGDTIPIPSDPILSHDIDGLTLELVFVLFEHTSTHGSTKSCPMPEKENGKAERAHNPGSADTCLGKADRSHQADRVCEIGEALHLCQPERNLNACYTLLCMML